MTTMIIMDDEGAAGGGHGYLSHWEYESSTTRTNVHVISVQSKSGKGAEGNVSPTYDGPCGGPIPRLKSYEITNNS
jgi:hypothetical protein